MAKIVEGVAMIAGAVVLGVVTAGLGAAISATMFTVLTTAAEVIGVAGVSLTLGGIAAALAPASSSPFSVKQPAAPRQIVYGQMRVSGIIVYVSTTNNGHDLNQVVCWAAHACRSVDTIYIDGRATHIPAGGGQDNGNTYYDTANNSYSFGSTVHAWNSLGPVPGTYFSDLGSRDSNWNSNCTLDGITASYVRTTYDPNRFSGVPGLRASIHGKNNIYDPRTSTYGYTNNAALIIADFLCNTEFGVGCNYATEIDQTQLIAAANLCDESVTLAAGGTEARYTINGVFDTASTPGDVLEAMLSACEGRISYSGGQWKIYPAAFWGSGLTFAAADLAGPVKWIPKRKYRDLVNAVRATFVSPLYPYASVGYDQDHKNTGIFSGQWQPTDSPEYAQDALHGYVSDANLSTDGNVKLYADRAYRFVTSVATAQRLQKIFLLRNRQQGSGTLIMKLSAYQVIAQDVIQFTLPALSWTNKYLEVQQFRFVPKTDHNSGAPTLTCEIDVVETDPSVYLWSSAEELSIQDSQSPALYNIQVVNAPTSLTLESGADSAVIGADGVVLARIHASWTEPDDPFVLSGGHVELQWQKVGETIWHTAGHFTPTVTDYFIVGVVAGQNYNVQVQASRSNGATSAWTAAGPHTVSTQASSFTILSITGLGQLASRNYVDFSSGTISGAGSLAQLNAVDLATGEVLNKQAANLQYSTGLSIEALRPAQANADATAGKSIDILADGSTYVRTKSTQVTGGVILGKSYGYNAVPNPGFELVTNGVTVADDWTLISNDNNCGSAFIDSQGTNSHSGKNTLIIRAVPYFIPNSDGTFSGCRVMSTAIPIVGGQPLFIGGYYNWAYNMGIPAGDVILLRMAAYLFDGNFNFLTENYIPDIQNGANNAWVPNYGTVSTPTNAAFVRMELALFIAGNTQIGANLCADLRFDDVFLVPQLINSGFMNSQGSILPSQPITINYSVTKNSVTFSWSAQSVLRSDGSTITTNSSSWNPTGLSSSTTYYTYWYISAATGGVIGSGPYSSVQPALAAAMGQDGRIPIGPISFTTLAASNGGSSGGTGGGAGTCPEAAELVEVEGKGQIPAGDVVAGDRIKGQSMPKGGNVYRVVRQVHQVHSVAWRIVRGHRVSPSEPVWFNDEWMPAYRASADMDLAPGKRVHLTVDADDYNEANFWLVAGEPLLVHNIQMLAC